MNRQIRNKLYDKAIKKYTKHLQVLVAIEEMSELIQVLIHSCRKDREVLVRDIVTEIADVKIMMEQLEIMFSSSEFIDEEMTKKMLRLESSLNNKL